MATAHERRLKVRDKYRTIIGRNRYSQPKRNYCYKKYSDGKYYSDCSSSVSWTYKVVGESFGILNTVGMWTSNRLVDVPVKISKGIIQNPDILRIGDMLLFAGNDAGRKKYGYVGHVEMVGEIESGRVTLYGHGSGLAKKHEMNAYCRSRYNTRAATPLGRRLLIRVRRAIADDPPEPESGRAPSEILITGATINVRSGPGKKYMSHGAVTRGTLLNYQGITETVDGTLWHLVAYKPPGAIVPVNGWVSGKYAKIV